MKLKNSKRPKLAFATMPKEYAELCRLFLPRPIRDKTDFEEAKEVADAMAGFEEAFSADQEDYFDLLCSLLEDFEPHHTHVKPLPAASGIDTLKHLMSERGMAGADLSRLLGGSRLLGPMILRGERRLTADHIRTLAFHFKISADAFLVEATKGKRTPGAV